MGRVSSAYLMRLVAMLARRTGRPAHQWYPDDQPGMLYLDRNIGGWRLFETVRGGGARERSPRLRGGEMATFLEGAHAALDLADWHGDPLEQIEDLRRLHEQGMEAFWTPGEPGAD